MDQHNKEAIKKKKEIIEAYTIAFGSDHGKIVLSDLEKRCHEFITTHQKGDSHETAFLEGQRSVLVFIKAILKSK
jgi:hypothetical protein|tara:strand:+ start:1473 stop:1697 length:225 start_codon:yes stop_codon:yes gene_type:complete